MKELSNVKRKENKEELPQVIRFNGIRRREENGNITSFQAIRMSECLPLLNETSHSLCGSGSPLRYCLAFTSFVYSTLHFLFWFFFILFHHSVFLFLFFFPSLFHPVQHVSVIAFNFVKSICNTWAHIHREKYAHNDLVEEISFLWHFFLLLGRDMSFIVGFAFIGRPHSNSIG